MQAIKSKSSYHHGDLRATLLVAARQLLTENGIEGLSLRKLADQVGVSRTAPYHHFKDKNALLSAIAEEGFLHWQHIANDIFATSTLPLHEKLRLFVRSYLRYAVDNPQLYDLMFGRTLWQQGEATDSLKQIAYPCFQHQVALTRQWQQQGLINTQQDTLRLSQVIWGTMHGIARLLIDGIYADASHLDEMSDCAVAVFLQHSPESGTTS